MQTKSWLRMIALLALISAPILAVAQDAQTPDAGTPPLNATELKVISQPSIEALMTVLNQKHAGQCKLPSESSQIQWRCGGLVLPVEEPEMTPSSCGFIYVIDCPTEKVNVYGAKTSYFVNLGKKHPMTQIDLSTPEIITYGSFKFEAK